MENKSYYDLLKESDDYNITTLIEQNKILYKNIENMNKFISSMKDIIDENNDYILENCNHKWYIDHSILDDKTVFSCSICNLQTYNKNKYNKSINKN